MNDKTKNLIKEILSYVIIIGAVILFRTFLYSPIRVTGKSMVPTLKDGNIMILNKIGYRINGLKRFDIVVIDYDKERLIKRVVGLPGEEIKYVANKLYINGEITAEEYKRGVTYDFDLESLGYNVIPEGKYLVLGDNREVSKDSRIIGLIDADDILGYTKTVIFPFNEIKQAK